MTIFGQDLTWDSPAGGAVLSAALILVLLIASFVVNRIAKRVFDDKDQPYNVRRIVRVLAWFVGILGLIVIWRPLGGSLAPALGIATAGLAFAMQEAVGAVAGWFNITFGSIFRVGDRVQMGGVQGDVIDISLLKTRLMEIGDGAGTTWVGGRQYTGRVVTVSNKSTFTDPVYNYSAFFEYIWEEIAVAIPHHEDWQSALWSPSVPHALSRTRSPGTFTSDLKKPVSRWSPPRWFSRRVQLANRSSQRTMRSLASPATLGAGSRTATHRTDARVRPKRQDSDMFNPMTEREASDCDAVLTVAGRPLAARAVGPGSSVKRYPARASALLAQKV